MESPKAEAETRDAQAEKVIDFLDRINAYEFFEGLRSDPKNLKEIYFEQFEDFLMRINGIARDIPIAERQADGDGVHLESKVDSASVPNHEDKLPILKEAYEAVPNLAHQEDLAYMLPLIINAVHLFVDGNGRSSRIMHLLLKSHASKEEFNGELKKALGEYGRYYSYDVSPNILAVDVEKIVLAHHGVAFGTENNGWDPQPPEGVTHFWNGIEYPQSEGGKKFKKLFRDDYHFSFIVAYNYLKERNLLDQTIVNYRRDGEDEDRLMLSPAKMDEILQPEDWDNLIHNLDVLKRERVETMVRAFVEPEKYTTLDGTSTLRDELIKKVTEENQRNNS